MTDIYPQTAFISEDMIKILLIEDDETDAKLVKIYAGAIPNAQIEIDWVKSTSEARQRLQSRQYDLCIFDFWLRTHTSLPLLQDLRGADDALPVIILSHMTNEHMLQVSVASGACYVLGKDELSVTTLASAIDTMLFDDSPNHVRLPRTAVPKPGYNAASGEIAGKLVKVMDDMHTFYAHHRPDLDASLHGSNTVPMNTLETLRQEVSLLRLEWQANLYQNFDAGSKIATDYHDVADLIEHTISAMTPVMARISQTWQLNAPATAIRAKCDAVTTVLLLMEQLYAISSAAPPEMGLTITLSLKAGRASVVVGAPMPPPRNWKELVLPQFFDQYLAPRQFSFTAGTDDARNITVEVLFPYMLN